MVERERRPFRSDPRERTRRDLERFTRSRSTRGFFRSLALIGTVGWPIVVLATGAGLLGYTLHRRVDTPVRLALVLVVAGAALGTWIAYRSVREASS